MIGEVWEKLPGYENRYFVSNMGRVAKKQKYPAKIRLQETRKWQYQKRVLSLYPGNDGWMVSLQLRKGKRVTRSVRRLIGSTFMYAQPEDRVFHVDGDIYNCRLDNLRLSCYHHRTKLNPKQVDYCVEQRAKGVLILDLAQRFMIHPRTVLRHLGRRRDGNHR